MPDQAIKDILDGWCYNLFLVIGSVAVHCRGGKRQFIEPRVAEADGEGAYGTCGFQCHEAHDGGGVHTATQQTAKRNIADHPTFHRIGSKHPDLFDGIVKIDRSEERRVGKECRYRWS